MKPVDYLAAGAQNFGRERLAEGWITPEKTKPFREAPPRPTPSEGGEPDEVGRGRDSYIIGTESPFLKKTTPGGLRRFRVQTRPLSWRRSRSTPRLATTCRRITSAPGPSNALRREFSYCFHRAAMEAAGLRAAEGWITPQKTKPFCEGLRPTSLAAATAAAERLSNSLPAYRKPSASTRHSQLFSPKVRLKIVPVGGRRRSFRGNERSRSRSGSSAAIGEVAAGGGGVCRGLPDRGGAAGAASLAALVFGFVRGLVIFTEVAMTSTDAHCCDAGKCIRGAFSRRKPREMHRKRT